VVGGGPAGYSAAIRAAQLGLEVVLVEREELGGECLNHGCIPSKALIHVAEIIGSKKSLEEIGISASFQFEYSQVAAWKNRVVLRLRDGIAGLCRKYGVEVIQGEAEFLSSSRIRVRGGVTLDFKKAIIATGSRAAGYPGVEFSERVVTSRQILGLEELPERLAILGAGYIGVELGDMLAKLGCQVEIVQRSDRILTKIDPELAGLVQQNLTELGVRLHLNSRVRGVEEKNGEVVLKMEDGGRVEADLVLVAVGHTPALEGLGLETTKIEKNNSYIKVDETLKTTDPLIYAAGDITGPPLLAHKAYRQGKVAAEVVAGLKSAFDNTVVPAVVFTDPEIATVGLTEEEAVKAGYPEVKTARFPFHALGRALTLNQKEGFVKIVTSKNSLLGVHIAGPGAAGMISEAALALEMAATTEDLALTIHPHPTLPEAIMEAAEKALGTNIHT